MNVARYLFVILLCTYNPFLADQSVILIRNAILIDGTGGPIQYGQDVLIEDSKITKIGSNLSAPQHAEIIDCNNEKTVIPGLVDMHGHLYGMGRSQFDTYPVLYLSGGVTTIFSPGEFEPERVGEIRKEIAAGERIGPDIYFAGPYFDTAPSMVSFIDGVKDSIDLVAKFEYWKDRIDGIKVYTNISKDHFRILSDLAKKNDLFITGHLISLSTNFAISNGINGLEHGLEALTDFVKFSGNLVDFYCALSRINLESADIEAMIQMITKNQVYVDPTLVLIDAMLEDFKPVTEDLDYFLSDSTESHLARSRALKKRMYKDGCITALMKAELNFVYKIYENGGLLVAGTDPVSFDVLPGYGIKREIELMQIGAGIPLVETLKIASLNGARVLGIDEEYGSIEEGKIANLSIVNGSVDEDVKAIYNTETIIKNGIIYDSAKLITSMEGMLSHGDWIPNK